ncbi:MAG: hypothetical protein ILO34_05825, partial [Kiritimatiellae bacterium]|nr:hypothetical protein [Kiritimatiellia bacterium]
NAAASSRDGNQKMLARQSNEAAEGLEELVANDMAEAKRATAAEEDDGEDGGDTPPAATPEAAAGKARESLDRSLKRRAKSLGTASLRFGGNGRPAGSIDRRIDDLARELKLADDPENARKLLEESGWFRIRGAAKDGVGEHELKDIPAEYRDLVRLYFLKLAE